MATSAKKRYLIAANWKMNPPPHLALLEASGDRSGNPYHPHADVDVVVFPTFLDIASCIGTGLIVGAQYGHPEPNGAHTGDVSMAMIAKIGCRYVLCGHSDRRAEHQETDTQVGAQAVAALEAALHPIICIGETLDERKAGKQKKVIERQMKALPLGSDITLAYEPVWAISRGDPNTPAASEKDAEEMHTFIRSLLPKERQTVTRILYGGSMKASNAEALLKQPNIDGGLVGGASLKPEEFAAIVSTAERLEKL